MEHSNDFEVGLTKEQIESFPPYNDSNLESEQGRSDYEKRYRSKWESGPVMHRLGTDRNITPTTKQMEGSPAGTTTGSASLGWGAGSESGDAERSTTTTDRIIPAGTDTVEISNSAVGIGGRSDTFQSRLRPTSQAGCGWLQDLHRRCRFRARQRRYLPQGCLAPIFRRGRMGKPRLWPWPFPATAH